MRGRVKRQEGMALLVRVGSFAIISLATALVDAGSHFLLVAPLMVKETKLGGKHMAAVMLAEEKQFMLAAKEVRSGTCLKKLLGRGPENAFLDRSTTLSWGSRGVGNRGWPKIGRWEEEKLRAASTDANPPRVI
jgi:hypothetical protein